MEQCWLCSLEQGQGTAESDAEAQIGFCTETKKSNEI
jgi:hypothetical protein